MYCFTFSKEAWRETCLLEPPLSGRLTYILNSPSLCTSKEIEKAFNWGGLLCGIHAILDSYQEISCRIAYTVVRKVPKLVVAARVVIVRFNLISVLSAVFVNPSPHFSWVKGERGKQSASRSRNNYWIRLFWLLETAMAQVAYSVHCVEEKGIWKTVNWRALGQEKKYLM